MSLPKQLHAIWLGNVLDEVGCNNIVNWRSTNPDYQMNLWIDSALFDEKNQHDYLGLQEWADRNNITICDLASSSEASSSTRGFPVLGKSDFYNDMLNKQFYDDEINGVDKNFAAASDILRIEILYRIGGVYFDARDIFPDKPLRNLQPKYGFYYRAAENYINTDLLASAPLGTIAEMYRNLVHDHYEKLYENEKQLRAHRNPQYTTPFLYNGQNSRLRSTMELSGPASLTKLLITISHNPIFIQETNEIFEANVDETQDKFPTKFYFIPPSSDLSWINREELTQYEYLIPLLRNLFKEYFNEKIDSILDKHINLTHTDNPFASLITNQRQENLENRIQLFKDLKIKLNVLPVTLPMQDTIELITNSLDRQTMHFINRGSNNLLTKLIEDSEILEQIISYCETYVDPEIISSILSRVDNQENNPFKLDQFMVNLLNIDTSSEDAIEKHIQNIYDGSIFSKPHK